MSKNYFEETLYKASSTCDGSFKYISEFSKIYPFATENVSGYIDYFDLKDKSLLTVGSSGDQVLNAFYNGARDITLFDINEYAKFYVYLKIAAILSLSYKEFKAFFFRHGLTPFVRNHHMFSPELYEKIKGNLRLLDYESFLFFDELFSLYEPTKIRERMFDDDEDRNVVIKGMNKYLKDEESYNKLQAIIRKINFRYIHGNIGRCRTVCSLSALSGLRRWRSRSLYRRPLLPPPAHNRGRNTLSGRGTPCLQTGRTLPGRKLGIDICPSV